MAIGARRPGLWLYLYCSLPKDSRNLYGCIAGDWRATQHAGKYFQESRKRKVTPGLSYCFFHLSTVIPGGLVHWLFHLNYANVSPFSRMPNQACCSIFDAFIPGRLRGFGISQEHENGMWHMGLRLSVHLDRHRAGSDLYQSFVRLNRLDVEAGRPMTLETLDVHDGVDAELTSPKVKYCVVVSES